MNEWVFLLVGLLVVLLIGGPICSIIALVKNRKLRLRLQALENEVKSLRTPAPREEERPAAPMEEEIHVEPTPAPVEIAAPPADHLFPPLDSESEDWDTLIPPPEEKRPSLEMKLGTKWLNWVGIVMVVLGIAFFLKYAYDNAWIGPKGRLSMHWMPTDKRSLIW